ncbi:hypothetical protein GGR56DRAFT_314913 [Xylariaceae sp. FL0804]|nr:hypothetical protein GGR56DRAFT_314913 [Xylariaceae sp. FL0804]
MEQLMCISCGAVHDMPPVFPEAGCETHAIRRIGFREDIASAILRYWIHLTLNACGGPHSVFGVAIGALAELGSSSDINHNTNNKIHPRSSAKTAPRGEWREPPPVPRAEWPEKFAETFDEDVLEEIRAAGVYSAVNFSQAKLLVYRLIVARWNKLTTKGCIENTQ